jgi:hypothetical protein
MEILVLGYPRLWTVYPAPSRRDSRNFMDRGMLAMPWRRNTVSAARTCWGARLIRITKMTKIGKITRNEKGVDIILKAHPGNEYLDVKPVCSRPVTSIPNFIFRIPSI